MTLRVGETFVAEGDPVEVATCIWSLLEITRMKRNEEIKEISKQEAEAFEKFINTPIWQLIEQEKEREKEDGGTE